MYTCIAVLLLAVSSAAAAAEAPQKSRRVEQAEDYYDRWLSSDVKYIVTDQERDVFTKLTTPDEKAAFIEQFWFRRDPTPQSRRNEFKEEHYRRIAFANERFQSGKPGWMTDRGRVYIIHGEPDYIERHPSGGSYERKISEGGLRTFTYPFEVWYYRQIDGMEGEVQLEFVDSSFSGEYRLALRPEEKDMLLYVSGTAPTLFELMRRSSGRVDRAFFSPGNEQNAAWQTRHGYSSQDTPFARYARFAVATRAPEVKFPDLRQAVTAYVTYNDLPFQVRVDYVPLNAEKVLVPVTFQIENRELSFQRGQASYAARVNIYGVVKNMLGRIVTEFEDTLVAEYAPDQLEKGRLIKTLYQKLAMLESGRRYRLDVVAKDQNSNRAGVVNTALTIPKPGGRKELMTSSLILSKVVSKAPADADPDEMFLLGDIRILPNVGSTFYPGESVGTYLQVYNVALDQLAQVPDIWVRYRIRQGDNVLVEIEEQRGESIQYASPRRVVLIRRVPLASFKEGSYEIEIQVEDRIAGKKTSQQGLFEVVPKPAGLP